MRGSAVAVVLALGGVVAGATIILHRPPSALASPPVHRDSPPATTPPPATRVAMRDVDFFVDPQVVLHIRRLDGTMRSKDGGPVVFDDKRSFILHLDRAEVGLTGADLGALLNRYAFNYRGCPLSHLSVRTSGSEVIQKGRLHKGVDLAFEIHSRLDLMPDGRIRLRPTKTTILGVNGAKLLGALHLTLEKLIDLRGARGVTVKGNDLFLEPDSLLPPPTIEGRLTAVRVEGDQVVQQFGPAGDATTTLVPPDRATAGYMYYRGGELRFGKLVMLDAEMEIVDLDRQRPFRFDLDRYASQLVAGYSRTLSDQGLEVFMRGVDQLAGAPGGRQPTACPAGVACVPANGSDAPR